MKGMILRHCPTADIVDITHSIPHHQVVAGAFVLAHSAPYFPEGTMHVVVVDPGVGTERSIMVGQFGGQIYLFPDNGVISLIKESFPLEGLVSVRNTRFMPDGNKPSNTFHGRDIFAPLAGQILCGAPISELGPTPQSFRLLDLPQPYQENDELVGRVMYVDNFGNLITNIHQQTISHHWVDLETLQVTCRGLAVGPVRWTYGQVQPGETLALINSMGLLEIAVNLGAAAEEFKAGLGAEVRIRHPEYLEAK